jgi:hypothetical protein
MRNKILGAIGFVGVAYGEDGDFRVMFAVSSRTKHGVEAAERAYVQMIRSYTREP